MSIIPVYMAFGGMILSFTYVAFKLTYKKKVKQTLEINPHAEAELHIGMRNEQVQVISDALGVPKPISRAEPVRYAMVDDIDLGKLKDILLQEPAPEIKRKTKKPRRGKSSPPAPSA